MERISGNLDHPVCSVTSQERQWMLADSLCETHRLLTKREWSLAQHNSGCVCPAIASFALGTFFSVKRGNPRHRAGELLLQS